MKVKKTITAIIFDGNKNYRNVLSQVLFEEGIQVTDTIKGDAKLLKTLKKRKPDILIYDLFSGAGCFNATLRDIASTSPKTKIAVLSFKEGREIINHCLAAGASGFFNKGTLDLQLLIKGFKEVCYGEKVVLD